MELNVSLRTLKAKKLKDLKKNGFVPGIIYSKHIKESIMVLCNKLEFLKLYKETGYSTAFTLKGEGVDNLVLIQDIQLDPVTDTVIHIDFLGLKKDEKVVAEVSVVLVGECPLEKLGEGRVQLVKDTVQVEALPQDLPRDIKVDVSKIAHLHDVVFVRDLEVSSKVKIMDDADAPVVTTVSLAEEVEEVPTIDPVAAANAPTPAQAKAEAEKAKEKEKDKK